MDTTLKVTGMTCNHCVMGVTGALKGVPGVKTVTVSLEKGMAEVSGEASREALVAAVRAEGYEAV